MEEKNYIEDLRNVEGCIRLLDKQMSEIRDKKRRLMVRFINSLPLQDGDLVEKPNGEELVIDKLFSAKISKEGKVEVMYTYHKAFSNDDEIYVTFDSNYFSLKKVEE